jgi:hypothetical protein
MDAETVELLLKLLGVLVVVSDVVIMLMLYIWRRHVREVDAQKEDLKKLGENSASLPFVHSMRKEFSTRLQEIETRHAEEIERQSSKHQREIERLEDKHHNEMVGLRNDMNGMGERLTDAISKSEEGVVRHIEAIGDGFQRQMGMLVKMIEKIANSSGNGHNNGT